ncbi:MAG TPA: hypothetical protein PLO37_04930 [Candidatus Hydrogenedentes bacterium]|nr:hypothetical protein [Candidatus Hydrogenedentota bacterium]
MASRRLGDGVGRAVAWVAGALLRGDGIPGDPAAADAAFGLGGGALAGVEQGVAVPVGRVG